MPQKKKLKILLVMYVVVVIVHKVNEHFFPPENPFTSWSYVLGMTYGLFVIGYALNMKCHSCGARQVLRRVFPPALRWPRDYCHACGANLARVE